jgi:hypothetical protein
VYPPPKPLSPEVAKKNSKSHYQLFCITTENKPGILSPADLHITIPVSKTHPIALISGYNKELVECIPPLHFPNFVQ